MMTVLLGDKASALTLLPSLRVLGEEQLGPVKDVHEYGELSLHQGP